VCGEAILQSIGAAAPQTLELPPLYIYIYVHMYIEKERKELK
jgi:hypothetical protein